MGGNTRVCVICNVSPAPGSLEESHNMLKFAVRAKRIRQKARITEVADEKTLLRLYREQIEELKRQLKEAREAARRSQQQQQHKKENLRGSSSSSSDEEDQDDAHVLVSAIADLESLILKAGAKSVRKAHGGVDGNEGQDALPRRSLDAALTEAESDEIRSEVSSPAASTAALDKSSLTTPAVMQHADDEDDYK